MNIIFFLLVFVRVVVNGWGRGDLEKYGPFQLALHSNLIKCDHDKSLNLDVTGVDVYFYNFQENQQNKTYKFAINEAAKGILSLPGVDRTKKFYVFVPGYKSNILKKTEDRIRETFKYLQHMYLIILDHSRYTNDKDGHIGSYERSVKYVYYIGRAVGAMLTELHNGFVASKQIHCIGHSLGAQMLGYTGETYFNKTGEKISRITALDPAGPCFSNSPIADQIRSGVADYVEVYHCNAGGLGTSSVLGDIDFFFNKKGATQPDCGTPLVPGIFDSPKAAKCNHKACVQLWTATISHPDWFPATKCDKYKDFKDGKCAPNESALAGFWNPGNATGVFYISTDGYNVVL